MKEKVNDQDSPFYLTVYYILALLVVLPGLFMYFHADDWFQIRPRNLSTIAASFSGDWNDGLRNIGGFYRPLVRVSFFIDSHLFELRSWGYHLTNSVYFLIICQALVCIYKQISGYCSILTIVIFSVFFLGNPLKNEALYWISGRTDLISGMFLLWAVYFSLKGIRLQRISLSYTALALFCLALLSKEAAYSGLFILPVTAFLGKKDLSKRQFWLTILGPVVISALFLFLRIVYLGQFGGYVKEGDTHSIFEWMRNALAILSALMCPWQMGGRLITDTPGAFHFLPGFALLFFSIGLLLLSGMKRVTVALLFFLLASLLPMVFILISPGDGTRVCLIPLAFWNLFLAKGLEDLCRKWDLATSLTAIIFLSGFVLQVQNMGLVRRFYVMGNPTRDSIQAVFDLLEKTKGDETIVFEQPEPSPNWRILDPGDSSLMAAYTWWAFQHGNTAEEISGETQPRMGLQLRDSESQLSVVISPVLQPWMRGSIYYFRPWSEKERALIFRLEFINGSYLEEEGTRLSFPREPVLIPEGVCVALYSRLDLKGEAAEIDVSATHLTNARKGLFRELVYIEEKTQYQWLDYLPKGEERRKSPYSFEYITQNSSFALRTLCEAQYQYFLNDSK